MILSSESSKRNKVRGDNAVECFARISCDRPGRLPESGKVLSEPKNIALQSQRRLDQHLATQAKKTSRNIQKNRGHSTSFKMARGNQRDKAREANQKKLADQVSAFLTWETCASSRNILLTAFSVFRRSPTTCPARRCSVRNRRSRRR